MKPAVFVMTDVVGSTALWEPHGDAMRAALEAHDGLVHGATEFAGRRASRVRYNQVADDIWGRAIGT